MHVTTVRIVSLEQCLGVPEKWHPLAHHLNALWCGPFFDQSGCTVSTTKGLLLCTDEFCTNLCLNKNSNTVYIYEEVIF